MILYAMGSTDFDTLLLTVLEPGSLIMLQVGLDLDVLMDISKLNSMHLESI